MVETQKQSNTEPQGVPEALDGFVGKVVQFSTIWKCPQCLEPTKKVWFYHLKVTWRPEADDRLSGKHIQFSTIFDEKQ